MPAPLSKVQREVMQIIWEHGELSVSEVRSHLAPRRDLARNTVQTMLVRLEDKGWLTHRQRGRTFFYSAVRPERVSLGAKVAELVDRLFSGAPEEMVNALLDYRGLTSDEAERIRAMIERAERRTEGDSK